MNEETPTLEDVRDGVKHQIADIKADGHRPAAVKMGAILWHNLGNANPEWWGGDPPEIAGVPVDLDASFDGFEVVPDKRMQLAEFADMIADLAADHPEYTVHATCDGWLPPEVAICVQDGRENIVLYGTRDVDSRPRPESDERVINARDG